MMVKIKFSIIVFGVLLFSLLLVANNYVLKEHFNVCTTQLRIVSDQEKYRAGIQFLFAHYDRLASGGLTSFTPREDGASLHDSYTNVKSEDLISYRDIDDFLVKNPDCCILHQLKSDGLKGIYDIEHYISLDFKVYYSEEGVMKIAHRDITFSVNACGNVDWVRIS